MNIFGSVKTLKIFEGIEESMVKEILENSQRENFPSGETIMEQDEEPNGKGYIIEAGSVNVFIDKNQTAKLTVGDIFGEFALLNEEPRTATIIAEKPVTAIVLSQETLFQMIENDDNSINKNIMKRMEENLENE